MSQIPVAFDAIPAKTPSELDAATALAASDHVLVVQSGALRRAPLGDVAETPSDPSAVRTVLGLDGYVFRNRIRNPSFAVNQRGKSGTIVLAAGEYGHDGVKGGANGATYTASTAGLDTTLTITAGSLILPIEYVLIEGGSYVLSQAGTAPVRVWQGTGTAGSGSYAAAPFTVTGLLAANQVNIEFGVGTVLRPQFEPGTLATAFERRPPAIELELCQRYYQVVRLSQVIGQVVSATNIYFGGPNRAVMRAAPTLTILMTSISGSSSHLFVAGAWPSAASLAVSSTSTGVDYWAVQLSGFSGLTTGQMAIGISADNLLSLGAEI